MADLRDLLAGAATGEENAETEEAAPEPQGAVEESADALEEVVAEVDEERLEDSPLAAALTAAFTKTDEVEEAPAEEAEEEAPAPEAEVAAPDVEAPESEAAAPDVEAPEAEAVSSEAEEAEGAEGEEATPEAPPISPYDLPGGWYVVHSYSGYENKVKANLESRISSMHMEDSIFDVVIPMEDVVEFKGGRKVTVKKKVFPGYILVRLYMDDDAWFVVRNTPGVTGFVGSGTKPTPLSRREVERILGIAKPEEEGGPKKKEPRFRPEWEVGETVRVVEGPFADFNGLIEDINIDQQKVRVLVDIFGRETPVELTFEQIQKY